MLKIIALSVFCICTLQGMAQVEGPPSLLLGLAGVTGNRGNLDVELIAEMIAAKQSELKKEFIKRTFYDNLDNKNYVVWEYAYNSLEILLNSQSKQAMEKELMEYAANVALVYTFSETYVQVSEKMCNSDLQKVIFEWNKKISTNVEESCFDCNAPSSCQHSLKGFFKLPALYNDSIPLNSILVDMVFEIMRKNKTLSDLGFFKSQLPLGEKFYRDHSLYLRFAEHTVIDSTKRSDFSKSLTALYARMEVELGVLIDYYYVIKLAVDKDLSLKEFIKAESLDSTKNKFPPSVDKLHMLTEDIAKISNLINTSTQEKDTGLSEKVAEALAAFRDFENRTTYRIEDLYYLDQVTYPLVVKLTLEYGLKPIYLDVAQQYRTIILDQLLLQAKRKLDKVYKKDSTTRKQYYAAERSIVKELKVAEYHAFVDILSNIYKLDESKTYTYYLNNLKAISYLFNDPNDARLIFNLADFLEKYTIIDKEENSLSIDVEEIILQLYRKYEARQNNKFSFYFSVGLNQTFSHHYKKTYELTSEEGDTLNSLAFASEKIGVKFKLRDWQRIRAHDYGEYFKDKKSERTRVNSFKTHNPIVRDFYILLYGSGLLYNIVNTTTDTNFNSPIVGASLGLAFFNSLDFNLFVNFPVVSDGSLGDAISRRQFYGFSFDVKISDYLTGVRQKRMVRQAEKGKAQ